MTGRVVVVGGGVSGLVTAYRLLRGDAPAPEVTLFEAGPMLGGKMRGVEVGGVELEAGADSFVVRRPAAVELCKELGLGDDLIVPAAASAMVWTRGRMVPFPSPSAFGIPATAGGVLRWAGLSLPGRLRALMDLLRPARREAGDEPLGALLRRRLGREATRAFAGPLLAGIHAGDAERLSVHATFPDLVRWEGGHGSLVRGARAARKAAAREPGALFATVWGGLSRMIGALDAAVGEQRIRRGAPVASLRATDRGYEVWCEGDGAAADAVVLATPAFESARLLSGPNRGAAGELQGIPYVSTAVVLLVYPEGTAGRVPDISGFVVPPGEGVVSACTWVSRKWPTEGFGDRAVARAFVGRAGAEEALDLADRELVDAVGSEIERAAPGLGRPEATRVIRWHRSMPQYQVGHLDRLARIQGALASTPGLFLTGSAYRGVGIADCIAEAQSTASRVLAYLGAGAPDARPDGDRGEREAIPWTS